MPTIAQQVESKLDVKSRGQDGEWACMCPWCAHEHEDEKPTLYVNILKGCYVCFRCHEKGGRMKLLKAIGGSGRATVDQASIRARSEALRGPNGGYKLPTLPETALKPYSAVQTPYWASRGITPEVIEAFDLGYSVEHHAGTIPLRAPSGKLTGFIRRSLHPNASIRYMEPKGVRKSMLLYGYTQCMAEDVTDLVITEGPMDCCRVWSAGYYAVALCGSTMSRFQERLVRDLAPRKVVMMFDNDKAGRDCTLEVGLKLSKFMPVREVNWSLVPSSVDDPGKCTDTQVEMLIRRSLRWNVASERCTVVA